MDGRCYLAAAARASLCVYAGVVKGAASGVIGSERSMGPVGCASARQEKQHMKNKQHTSPHSGSCTHTQVLLRPLLHALQCSQFAVCLLRLSLPLPLPPFL